MVRVRRVQRPPATRFHTFRRRLYDKIIRELLSGQATIAHSILPAFSWAYTPGTQYTYDPAKSKQLLREQRVTKAPHKFKYAAGQPPTASTARRSRFSRADVSLNVGIETLDPGTLRQQLKNGQFQMSTGVWVGGNQDPIFLKDLFTTPFIPSESVNCCNRSRYSNPEVDQILVQAIGATEREQAKQLYIRRGTRSAVICRCSRSGIPQIWWSPTNVSATSKSAPAAIGLSQGYNFERLISPTVDLTFM